MRSEAELLAKRDQRGQITGTRVTEAKIFADDHHLGVQQLDQKLARELRGRNIATARG